MNDANRLQRLERAGIRVIFTVPFFAPGVMRLPVELVDNLPGFSTAATDGTRIFWCRPFLDSLKDEEIVTVYCHEVAHCLLGHLWRIPADRDMRRWNEATDHAVNNMLTEFGEQVTARNLANPFPFPPGAYLCEPAYREKSEEEIYRLLYRPPQDGDGGDGDGDSGSGGTSGRKPFGEIMQPSASGEEKLRTSWEKTLLDSVAATKSRGELPGSMSRFVDALTKSNVPWWELVASWLREQANDDWNWLKPAAMYAESGFILPALHSDRIGQAVFAIDTSGSIDDRVLSRFKAEQQKFLDELRPERITEICCDAAVTRVAEFRPGETIDGSAPGGGGTRLEKVFEHIEQHELRPKCLVVLTDLYTSFPERAPDYPVLWVTWGSEQAPFGEVVKVEK